MRLKLEIDKLYHFVAGVIIFVLFCFFVSPLISMIPVTIIALAKELYDWMSNKGTPDIWDFIFTILGGLTVLFFVI